MLTSALNVMIHAQLGTIWQVMVDRLHRKQLYLSGVGDTVVVEESMAEMRRETEVAGEIYRELTTLDEPNWEIRSRILEHPLYTGMVMTRLVPTSVQNPMAPVGLEYILRLERKDFHLERLVQREEDLAATLRREMATIKELAEQREKESR